MNRSSVGILALACWIHSASPTLAAQIIQTQGFVGVPSVSKTVEFDRFKPEYGHLISAQWQLVLDVDGGAFLLDNDASTGQVIDVDLGARGTLSSFDVQLLDAEMSPIAQGPTAVFAATSSRLNLDRDDGDGEIFDATGADAGRFEGSSVTSSTGGVIHPSLLDAYIGAEMFELRINIEQTASVSDSRVSRQLMPVTVSPSVILIYEYTPVPEPAGHGLMGSGVLLAAATFSHRLRRRLN